MPFAVTELRIRLDVCGPLGGERGNGAKETLEAVKRLAGFWPVNTNRTWLPVRAARERVMHGT